MKKIIYIRKLNKSVPETAGVKETPSDNVNHPKHYASGKYECIDVMLDIFGKEAVQNFCLLNAFKYNYRCNNKGKKTEDIEKANWYLNKYIELEKGEV